MSEAPAPPVALRKANLADMEEVLALLSALGLAMPERGASRAAYLQQFWGNNPSRDAILGVGNLGWLLECHGRIVGFFGAVPRKYFWNGRPIFVLVATQWGVLKEFRGHTHRLAEAFFAEPTKSVKLVTTAIAPTGRIFARHGGRQAPIKQLGQTIFVPFRLGKLLANVTRIGAIAPIRWAMALTDLLLLPLQIAFLGASQGRLEKIDPGHIPEEWDQFWHETSQRCAGLLASFDRAELKWIFGSDRARNSKHIYVYRDGRSSSITAFVALAEVPAIAAGGIRRFKVLALLCPDYRIRRAVIGSALRLCRDMGADVVEFPLMSELGCADVPGIAMTRRFPSFPVYFWAEGEMAEALQHGHAWHLSTYDGDAIFS